MKNSLENAFSSVKAWVWYLGNRSNADLSVVDIAAEATLVSNAKSIMFAFWICSRAVSSQGR
jgi:hypothetical protein